MTETAETVLTVKFNEKLTDAEVDALVAFTTAYTKVEECTLVTTLPAAFDPGEWLAVDLDDLFGPDAEPEEDLGPEPGHEDHVHFALPDAYSLAREALKRLQDAFTDRANALAPYGNHSAGDSTLQAEAFTALAAVQRELKLLPAQPEAPAASGKHAV